MRWRPTLLWTVLIALSLFKAMLDMGQVSEFLYFQF
jgi:hypothetical protein